MECCPLTNFSKGKNNTSNIFIFRDPSMHKRKRGRGGRSRTPPVKIPISKKNKQNKEGVLGKNNGGTSTQPTSPQGGLGAACKAAGDLNSPARASRLVPRVNYDESEDNDEDTALLLKGFSDKNGSALADKSSPAVKLDGVVLAKSPTSNYIECPKPGCSKKFPMLEALKYHITALHREEDKSKQQQPTAAAVAAPVIPSSETKKKREKVNSLAAASASPTKCLAAKAEPAEPVKTEPPAAKPAASKPAAKPPVTEEKPCDLSTVATANGHERGAPPPPSARPPPPPPTTTAMKPSPNIQGVNYLSSPVSSPVPPGPPKAHQMTHHVPPPLMPNGFLNKPPEGTPSPLALNNKPPPQQTAVAPPQAAVPPPKAKTTTGPASPAYSDISDEETPTAPPPQAPPPGPPPGMAAAASMASLLGLGVPGVPPVRPPPPPSQAGPSHGPKPMFSNSSQPRPPPNPGMMNVTKERKTDGSAPTTQTLGPPPSHLPPDLHGGSLMGMLPPGLAGAGGSGPANQLLNQAYMTAMMQAMGQRMPGPGGMPPGFGPPHASSSGGPSKGALDVMAQHANNFLASSKLQELQEKVSKKPQPAAAMRPAGPPSPSIPPAHARQGQGSPATAAAQAAASMAAAANMASLLGLSVPQRPVPPVSAPPPSTRSSPSPMALRHEHNHTHLHLGGYGNKGGATGANNSGGGGGGAPTDLSLPTQPPPSVSQHQPSVSAAAAAALLQAAAGNSAVRPPPPPAAHGGGPNPSHASLLQGKKIDAIQSCQKQISKMKLSSFW